LGFVITDLGFAPILARGMIAVSKTHDLNTNDPRDGALSIYGSMSAIDLAKTTPEVFWTIFGTPTTKRAAERLLDGALEKLNAIKTGMPE
jgi:phosphopentomutase